MLAHTGTRETQGRNSQLGLGTQEVGSGDGSLLCLKAEYGSLEECCRCMEGQSRRELGNEQAKQIPWAGMVRWEQRHRAEIPDGEGRLV